MIAAALLSHREALGMPSYPSGLLTCDNLPSLVYASDMKVNYGAAQPISDANPTGSRVPSTGLVLSWDGHSLRSGKAKNFADPSGNTDGTLSGGVAAGGASGVRGAATAFDGVDDEIVGPKISVGNFFSVSAWVYPTGFQANQAGIISCINGQMVNRLMITDPGNIITAQLDVGAGQVNHQVTVPSLLNAWHHVVYSYDGASVRIFLDGALVYQSAQTGTLSSSSAGIRIGHGASAGYPANYHFGGSIEGLQLYNRALSNTEVRQIYEDTYGWVRNTANPHCLDIDDAHPLGTDRVASTGCFLALDMETLMPDGKLKDFSGAGNHATITGAKYQRGAIKNGSYNFTGAADAITTPITADYAQMTYAFWIRPANITTLRDVFGKQAGDRITMEATTGKIRFQSNGTLLSTVGCTANVPQFVIVKVDGLNVSFKLNNVANGSGTLNARVASSNPVQIGFFSTNSAFAGMISAPMLFSRITTDDEDTKLFYDGQKMLGLVQGGAASVPGQVGSAVDLNGTSQYVEIADCPALAFPQVTFGAWVNLDGFSGYPTIISKKGVSGASFKLYGNQAAPNNLISYYSDGVSRTATGGAMAANRWSLAAGTYNGANLIAYLDGVASAPTAFAASATSNASPLRIGIEYNSTSPADGRIAFPFVCREALTAAQIAFIHRIGRMSKW